jgi:tetratricopeptide (TPR) repeat protein
MSQRSFPLEWTDQYSDPYAVLGVSVVSDDRRVLQRYRDVAKLLHPDRHISKQTGDSEFATQLFARLVNPAYEKVKQEQGRREVSANLRINVRRLCREQPLSPKAEIAQQLMEHPASGVDVFYEQAIAKLALSQYEDFGQFQAITDQIVELNLVYLQLKMGETPYWEKRAGLVPATEAVPVQFTPAPANPEVATESYDQRHYRRAQEYVKKGAWAQAIQELRDALKIKADKSEYHALLGVAYLFQKLPGMAKVHLKRALEIDPKNPLGLKYGPKIGLIIPKPDQSQPGQPGQPGQKPNAAPSTNGRAPVKNPTNGRANGRVANGRVPVTSRSAASAANNSRSSSRRVDGLGIFRSLIDWLRSLLSHFQKKTPVRKSSQTQYASRAPERTKVR